MDDAHPLQDASADARDGDFPQSCFLSFPIFFVFVSFSLSLSLSLSQCVSIDPVDLAACKGKHAVVVEVREKKISRYLILFSS